MNSRSGQANTLTKSRVTPSWQKSTFAIKPSFTIQASDDDLPPPEKPNKFPLPPPFMKPNANPGLPNTSQPAGVPHNPQQNPDPANPAAI